MMSLKQLLFFCEVLVLFSKPSQKRALVLSANPTQRLPDKTGQTNGTLRAHLCSTHALMLCSLPYRFYMRVKPTASHRFFTYVSRQQSFTLSTGLLFTTRPTARADISRSSMTGCCRGHLQIHNDCWLLPRTFLLQKEGN